jgi:hypothetical protein
MRVVVVEATRATVELPIDELVLLMDALWQELDRLAKGRARRDEALRARCHALQEDLADLISEMDTTEGDPAGLS